MDSFVETGCMKALTEWMIESNKNKSPDLTIVLSILSSIAYTYTKVDVKYDIDIEFNEAIRTYLYEEGSGIIVKIRSLPESQLKEIQEDEFTKVLKDFYECSGQTMEKDSYITRIQFDILLLFLQSPYIDKKLTALNEIKKLLEKKPRNRESTLARMVAKWLAESNIINYIYQEAKHPELITRSADLIINLDHYNKLESETLEMIWKTCINEHKHEAITEATLNVVAAIARTLDPEMVNILIDHIHNLPITMFGEYIGILKQFYLNYLLNLKQRMGKSKAEMKMAELVDLGMLWKAIQDESDLSQKHKLVTLNVLIELMVTFDLENTSEFFRKAIENLKVGHSPVKCMILIEKILKNCTRRGYPPVLKKEDLVFLTIQSAEIYLNSARENSPMEGGKIEDVIFSGGLSHKKTIDKYFNFISNLLKNFDGHNKLSNDHIDYMFKVFVKESISQVERSSFYNFFTFDEFDLTMSSNKKIASSKNREYLFKNILCKELNSETTGS